MPETGGDVEGAGPASLLITLAFISLIFIGAMLLSLRVAEPEEILAAASHGRDAKSRRWSRWLPWLIVLGAMSCVGTAWLALWLLEPGNSGRPLDGALLVGGIVLFVLIGLPLLSAALLWIVGWLLPPQWLLSTYCLRVPADPQSAWQARRAIERTPEYSEYVTGVEKLTGGLQPRFRLYSSSFMARLLGMEQLVTLRPGSPGESLDVESESRSGDRERARLLFSPDAEGNSEVACTILTELRSPLLKVLTKVTGQAHMAKGGAGVEAERFARLLGAKVSVSNVQSTLHAHPPTEPLA